MKNTENIMLSQLQMTTYFSLFEIRQIYLQTKSKFVVA